MPVTRKINIAGLFFFIWLFCLIGFILLFVISTNFFRNMVFETRLGSSNLTYFIELAQIIIGSFSFILALFFGVLNFVQKKIKILTIPYIFLSLILASLVGYFFKVIFIDLNPSIPNSSKTFNTTPIVAVQQPTPSPTPTPKPKKLDGGRLFNLVNAYRAKNGMSQMLWFHPLCEYAMQRSQEIKDDWSHEGYLRDAESHVLYEKYCPDCTRTGENLAENYASEEEVLQAWIKSPSHKENLDADWTYACAYFYENRYVEMIFGKSNK